MDARMSLSVTSSRQKPHQGYTGETVRSRPFPKRGQCLDVVVQRPYGKCGIVCSAKAASYRGMRAAAPSGASIASDNIIPR